MNKYPIFLLALLIVLICAGQTKSNQLLELQGSHINANVPDKEVFDKILNRDLNKYFSTKYGAVKTNYEFLREGPTQSGVAYPKYYLWVKILKASKLIAEGAARVEAIDKKRFEITDFINTLEIKSNQKGIYTIFPAMVCEKIKSRL